MGSQVNVWLEKGEYNKLLELWVKGINFDWHALYKGDLKPKRISAPTYPFAKERYWLDVTNQPGNISNNENLSYELVWDALNINKQEFNFDGFEIYSSLRKSSKIAFDSENSKSFETIVDLAKSLCDFESDKNICVVLDVPKVNADYLVSMKNMRSFILELCNLVKCISETNLLLNKNINLIVNSNSSFSLLKSDNTNPVNSMLSGFLKTLVVEHANIKATLLDSDKPLNEHDLNVISNQSLCEVEVAIRENEFFVRRLKTCVIETNNQINLKEDGSYLIVGGTGGLGLITAQMLLKENAQHLILTCRNPHKTKVKLELDKLQANYPGRLIEIKACDIGDKAKVNNLVRDIKNLKGVIYGPGIDFRAKLISHTADDFDKMFAAKVYGSWYLHEALDKYKAKLDFFVCYSSISSTLGSSQQAAYAAGNSFLDGLVQFRISQGLVAQSIQWGPWGEVGMAESLAGENLSGFITNAEGLEALQSIINLGLKGVGAQANTVIIKPDYLQFMLDFVPNDVSGLHNSVVKLIQNKVSNQRSDSDVDYSWYQNFSSLIEVEKNQSNSRASYSRN